ncbi:hypothetical protein [Borrelia miyamotoi]|uniref:hypothetical protein n=1 Tax=Borrelia miyamotoi TaxID=47466 RepID=UPI0013C2D2B8|nr:hypothetical protein [Borrelia miyamotoi]
MKKYIFLLIMLIFSCKTPDENTNTNDSHKTTYYRDEQKETYGNQLKDNQDEKTTW